MILEKLLLVEDEAFLRENLEHQLRGRFEIASVDHLAAAQAQLNAEAFDLVIADVKLPDGQGTDLLQQIRGRSVRPLVIVISAFGSPESAVDCLSQGAFAYLFKPFSQAQLEAVLQKAESHARLLRVNQFLSRQTTMETDFGLLGISPAIAQLRETLRRVARTEACVLIQGESGTGKTLVARLLYEQSPRAGAACLKLDCASLPEALLETELFGCENQVIPGVITRRLGACELADGGTLLLEEVGVLPSAVQARLLRLLQTQTVERVGASRPMPVDVRLIATTSRNLEALVQRKKFPEDLWLALNILPLRVPPLRDRLEDLPILAEHFRHYFARKFGIPVGALSPACLNLLPKYAWPGNVRELQSMIQRAVLHGAPGKLIEPEHLGLSPALRATGEPPATSAASEELLSEAEKKHIFSVLARCQGNRTHAARRLGISIRTLRNKLKEYRLELSEETREQ